VEIDIGSENVAAGVAAHVRVRLSPRELNRLFLSGDTLILLPVDGIADDAAAAPIERTSIFLSEIAGSPEGFTRIFSDAAHAEAFATAVRDQIATALESA
jgi:hypothetical protein